MLFVPVIGLKFVTMKVTLANVTKIAIAQWLLLAYQVDNTVTKCEQLWHLVSGGHNGTYESRVLKVTPQGL